MKDDTFFNSVAAGVGCLTVLYVLAIIAVLVTAIVIGIHLAFG